MDTLVTVLMAHAVYTYQITNFGDIAASEIIPW